MLPCLTFTPPPTSQRGNTDSHASVLILKSSRPRLTLQDIYNRLAAENRVQDVALSRSSCGWDGILGIFRSRRITNTQSSRYQRPSTPPTDGNPKACQGLWQCSPGGLFLSFRPHEKEKGISKTESRVGPNGGDNSGRAYSTGDQINDCASHRPTFHDAC